MSNGFDLSLVAAKPALLAGENNIVDVLIRVQAPDSPKDGLPERSRLNLAIVIDRSGSMEGRPLHEAKRAAEFMIDSLKPTDRASVVAYDDQVSVLAESGYVEKKSRLKAAVSQIHSGGSTNLHGGWLKGAEETAKHLASNYTSRVLLLSDGQANHGLTEVDAIASQCAQLADKGITTSTYGLGQGFNEELMLAMAHSGRGNGYYSETAENLVARFQEEFSLLSSLCARNVRLSLTPLPDVKVEMLNRYETAERNLWRLPDLAYDGEAWAAVRLHLNQSAIPSSGDQLALLQASVAYLDLEGNPHQIPEAWLTLPVLGEKEYAATIEDARVLSRVSEAEAATLQDQASQAARHGDWETVRKLLARAREMAKHSPWLAEVVQSLEDLAKREDAVLFSKQANFGAANMRSRLRSKREFMAEDVESAVPMYLQRRVHQGGSELFGSKAPAVRYRLDVFDNYPVALIDGKRVLLDTGSPFSIGNGDDLTIDGKPFTLNARMGLTTEKLSVWMNTQIDALLGSDVLSEFVVSINWWQNSLDLAPLGTSLCGRPLPTKLLMGSPIVNFRSPEGMTRGILDTGAKLCYAPKRAVANKTPVNQTNDFFPALGAFQSDVYEIRFEFPGHSFLANCGVLPDSLACMPAGLTGIEWIIGTDLLRQGRIGTNLREGRISADWK